MNAHQLFVDSLINSCNMILGAGHFHELPILGVLPPRSLPQLVSCLLSAHPCYWPENADFLATDSMDVAGW